MKNWAPLIIVIVFIAILALLFGPGIYRDMQLRTAVSDLLSATREGRTADIVALVQPSQRQEVARLFNAYLPADYQKSISSIKLSRTTKLNNGSTVTIVTCKIASGDILAIYQGQLVWHYTGGNWELDFLGSAGAEFSPAGEPAWVRLSDLMPLAENL